VASGASLGCCSILAIRGRCNPGPDGAWVHSRRSQPATLWPATSPAGLYAAAGWREIRTNPPIKGRLDHLITCLTRGLGQAPVPPLRTLLNGLVWSPDQVKRGRIVRPTQVITTYVIQRPHYAGSQGAERSAA
jgi:hypothetical protein